MTIITNVQHPLECPVHEKPNKCAYRSFPQTANALGTILGLCERCGYQVEVASVFSVRYRLMDEPSITLTHEEFMRNQST